MAARSSRPPPVRGVCAARGVQRVCGWGVVALAAQWALSLFRGLREKGSVSRGLTAAPAADAFALFAAGVVSSDQRGGRRLADILRLTMLSAWRGDISAKGVALAGWP